MNERKKRISWTALFINIAQTVAKRSPDPHTQVGAVIVKNNRILSFGYNGTPNNFLYDFDWLNQEEKNKYVVHAENNALANAAHVGADVEGADIYLTMSPCHMCIKSLIQAGIKRVLYLEEYKDFEITKKIVDHSNTLELIKVEQENFK